MASTPAGGSMRPRFSFTAAQRDPDSPLAEIRDRTVDEVPIRQAWEDQLRRPQRRFYCPSYGSSLLGQAVEAVITYDLTGRLRPDDGLAVLSDELIDHIGSCLLAVLNRPEPKRLSEAVPELLRLTNLLEIARALAKNGIEGAGAASMFWDQQISKSAPPIDEVSALAAILDAYRSRGRDALAILDTDGRPDQTLAVTAQVSLTEGCMIADLVIGRTVIDIKTSGNPIPDLSRQLRQVLGYGLAAVVEGQHIDSIGVYHANEALLMTWPLISVLKQSGESVPNGEIALHRALAGFTRAVQCENEHALRRRSAPST